MQTQTHTGSNGAKVRKLSKAATRPVKVTKTEDGKIPLKAICSKLGIDPKMARRKLRNVEFSGHDSRERWNFTKAQAEKAREILAG